MFEVYTCRWRQEWGLDTGGWGIDNASFSFDFADNTYSGSATVSLPAGFSIGATFSLADGALDELGVSVSGLNEPIGDTGWFFNGASGSIANLTGGSNPITFTGGIDCSFGPNVGDVKLPGWLGGEKLNPTLATLDLKGSISSSEITGSGTLDVLNGLASATVSADLKFATGVLTATGDISLVDNVLVGSGTFTVGNGQVTLQATGQVVLPVSSLSFLTQWFGGNFNDISLASGNFYLNYQVSAPLSSDYVEVWGNSPLTKDFASFFSIPIGVRVGFDGSLTELQEKDLASLPSPLTSKAVRLSAIAPNATTIADAASPVTQTFSVAPGTPWLLLGAQWTNSNADAVIEIQSPDGTTFTEADFAQANNMGVVDQMTGSDQKTVGISDPTPGNWKIIVPDTTGLGSVSFIATAGIAVSNLQVTTPTTEATGQKVKISYNATSSDSSATVTLYYTTTNNGGVGIPIVKGLKPNTVGNYQWNTANVPSGTYSIFAVLSSPNVTPVFSYAAGTYFKPQLVFAQAPTTTQAGTKFIPAIIVEVEDGNGHIITADNSKVSLSVASGPGVIQGTATVSAKNGVATFTNLTIKAAGAFILKATDGSLSATRTDSFAVTPSSAVKMAVSHQPLNTIAGNKLSIQVSLRDAMGNLAVDDDSTVTLALSGNPSGANLSGDLTAQVQNGIATFNGVSITKAGTYTFTITDGNLPPIKSAKFVIAPDVSTSQLAIVHQPASAVSVGKSLAQALTIGVEDQYGNLIASNHSKVSLTVANGPGGALMGTTVATFNNGLATFGNLSLNETGVYTLNASDASLVIASPLAFAQTVTQGITTIAPPTVAAKYAAGKSITLSVALKSSAASLIPFTGNATIMDQNDDVLGSITLTGAGVAKIVLNPLTSGTYSCVIAYTGDTNHTAATSADFFLTVD